MIKPQSSISQYFSAKSNGNDEEYSSKDLCNFCNSYISAWIRQRAVITLGYTATSFEESNYYKTEKYYQTAKD